jgi:CRP-like cAMP-binding protein
VRILNLSALPLRILGRVRTVSDGMIYPASIALGGGLLLVLQAHLGPGGIAALALLGALALLVVEIAVGRSFLPTLVQGLRAGAVDLDGLAESLRVLPASFTADVRHLLASADPQARAVGLALAQRLHPGALLGEVAALAPGADAATRRAVASVLARAPAAELEPVVRRLLASGEAAQQVLALQVALARGLRLDEAALAPLRAVPTEPIATLSRRLGAGAAGPVATLDRESAAALIEAAVLAGGADAGTTLGPLLEQAMGDDDDPAVRAAVLGVVAKLAPTPQRVARTVARLADPDRRVRGAAAEAVAALGYAAIEALDVPNGEASGERWRLTVRALGGMQSARARARLQTMLAPVLAQAAANAALMAALPAGRDPARWEALEAGLADSNLRLVERVLAVLAALRRDRVVAEVRRAIGSSDRRTRANAVEALAALPGTGMLAAVLPLVEAGSEPQAAGSGGHDGDAAIALAERSWDPWVRRGAAALRPAGDDGAEVDMDLILFLRRTPLFGSLPLDTLLALSRALVAESYLAGETVFADGAPGHCLYLVRAGSVEVRKHGRVLARRGPCAYAGEMALIDDAPRSASVVAAEDCTLLRLDRATFHDLTEDHPAMLRELAQLLATNLREANRRLAQDVG